MNPGNVLRYESHKFNYSRFIFISCVFVINKHFQIRIIENTTLGTLLEVMELNGRIFGLRKVMAKVMIS